MDVVASLHCLIRSIPPFSPAFDSSVTASSKTSFCSSGGIRTVTPFSPSIDSSITASNKSRFTATSGIRSITPFSRSIDCSVTATSKSRFTATSGIRSVTPYSRSIDSSVTAASKSSLTTSGGIRISRVHRRFRLKRSIAMSSVAFGSSTTRFPAEEESSASAPVLNDVRGGVGAGLLPEILSEALVWSSLHGLVVGDKNVQSSGNVPGVGMVHAPFALLPVTFPENLWKQACELAPLFNELVDRVSLDGKFLQESLSRTRGVDSFTGRLLDIHSKMLELNKTEDIRLGLHRSDYMLDAETKQIYQIELNTISASFPGLSCIVSKLHRNLLNHYGDQLGLESERVPENTSVSRFAEALAMAWNEYNDPSSIVLVVIQPEERNMYDQYWLSTVLKEEYPYGVTSIRKTLAEVDAEGKLYPDGTFWIGGRKVAVVYFRSGYSPNDYPSEAEWRARLMMEQSSAIKCPSISYHLVGTKKIQQELAKPNVLERFISDKEDAEKLRKCFAGLWSLDDTEILNQAMENPQLFVLKPQREGGGNNIYGEEVKETLIKLQMEGNDALAAYILMQRIFPASVLTYLVRDGICHSDFAISELGIYGAYLRNKDKVVMNDQSGYLMRTKVSSSNEGGVAAGYAVLDSIYLT